MRVPLSWLREFVPVEAEPEAIAERLSLTGLAVEEIVRTGRDISGVVVGEVLAMREHPNADSLMLVRATDGATARDIVCGARNYAVGDRVPMAIPGARLPGGMEIARRVVRGETSDGMLCSARELELADDHSGILILDPDAPLGKDLVSALELAEVVFDVDVTPNRPDCLSVLGVAREVGAIFGLPVSVPERAVPEGGGDARELATIAIEDQRGCPRYVARIVEGVAVARSPWRLRRRLMAAGLRPISNVVDVTNYVMLERGQPLHAFDLDALRGPAIVVRRPRAGEATLVTLDGVERRLGKQDVMICDAERPVAVGGVMGGAHTEVSVSTTRVLLESASFDPVRITRTARRLGLRSEASVRFERGVDREGARTAADLAAALFAELAGGTVARGALDAYPRPGRRRPVRVRARRANELIGIDITAAEMASSLRAIGCDVEASRAALRATPPTWRLDLRIEEDLIEEIARLYGYDRVPSRLPGGARAGGLSIEQQRRRRARALLLAAGLSEAQTLSLLPPSFADRLALPDGHPWRASVMLANPLSEDESLLRPALVPGLLLAAQRNASRRVLPVRLFEIGVVFAREGDGVAESMRAAFVMTGPAPEGWHEAERALDFFDGKGALAALLDGLGVAGWSVRRAGERHGLHPGRASEVLIDEAVIGSLAELDPRTAEVLELPRRVVVAEVSLSPVLAAIGKAPAPSIPRFPAVARDIAVVIPDDQPAGGVEEAIRRAGGRLLEQIELFDVYRGDPIPPGHVSLAYALSFRDPERTLTDADADAAFGAIAGAIAAAGWSIRD